MGERECAADLQCELERKVDRERPFTVEKLLEGFPGDVLEDDELMAVLFPAVDDGDDPRMAQPGGGAGFTTEALDVLLVIRVAVVQDLERDHPLQQPVVGAVDVRHPADPDELLELITPSNDFADHGDGHFPYMRLRKRG